MYPAELPPHVRPAPDLPRSAPRCHGVFRSGGPRTAFRGPLPCRSTRAATAAGSHIRQLRLSGRGEREAPRAVGADVLETAARVRPRQRAEREQPHHESNVGRHASTAARAPGRGLRGARWCRVAVAIAPAAAVAAFSRRRLLRCGGDVDRARYPRYAARPASSSRRPSSQAASWPRAEAYVKKTKSCSAIRA